MFYKDKYERIIKKRTRSLVDDDEEEKQSEIKKMRVIKLYKDPVKDLPDVCHNILTYFKGKELLKLAEVSKSWKLAIDSFHVKRVLSNIKLKIVDGFLKEDLNILKINNRPYKHLELIDCFEEETFLIKRYSVVLETLLIMDSIDFNRIRMPACQFPHLKVLNLFHTDVSWFEWLHSCNFMCLNELRYTHQLNNSNVDFYEDWIDHMSDLFILMPHLKRLYMRTQIDEMDDIAYADYQFELEYADLGHQFPKLFLDKQIDTLRVLRAGGSVDDIYYILDTFENLKVLAIDIEDIDEVEDEEESDDECFIYDSVSEDEDPLPVHENITTLFIRSESDALVRRIISSLVNLETLVFYDTLTKNDVEFLGKF